MIEFSCEICDKSFLKKSKLERHLLSHSNQRQFVCPHCEKSYKRAEHLACHILVHGETEEDRRPYSCSICTQRFRLKHHLNRHLKLHENDGKYKCDHCDASFSKQYQLKQHIFEHTGKHPYTCPECDKSFKKSSHLNQHFPTHSQEFKYICGVCESNFVKWSQLQAHIKEEHRPVCKICQKTFTKHYGLRRHEREIHGIGLIIPVETPIQKSSSQENHPSEIANDIVLNNTQCIPEQNQLEGENVKTIPIKLTRRVFPCSECEKSFKSEKSLKVHVQVKHLGIKPFFCQICSADFAHKHLLCRHMRIHSRQENDIDSAFVCLQCSARFPLKHLLTRHMKVHERHQENHDTSLQVWVDNQTQDYHNNHTHIEKSNAHDSSSIYESSSPIAPATQTVSPIHHHTRQIQEGQMIFHQYNSDLFNNIRPTYKTLKNKATTNHVINHDFSLRNLTGMAYIEDADKAGKQLPCPVDPDHCAYRFSRVYDQKRHATSFHRLEAHLNQQDAVYQDEHDEFIFDDNDDKFSEEKVVVN